jgi:hypothetical protein
MWPFCITCWLSSLLISTLQAVVLLTVEGVQQVQHVIVVDRNRNLRNGQKHLSITEKVQEQYKKNLLLCFEGHPESLQMDCQLQISQVTSQEA